MRSSRYENFCYESYPAFPQDIPCQGRPGHSGEHTNTLPNGALARWTDAESKSLRDRIETAERNAAYEARKQILTGVVKRGGLAVDGANRAEPELQPSVVVDDASRSQV